MKKQQWLLGAGLLVFVGLLIGATLLYNSLAVENTPDNLVVVTTTTATTAAPSVPETSGGQTADTDPAATSADPAQTTAPAQNDAPAENTAPDFTVTDRSGNPVKLSDLRGKPVILNFWASWCGPCKSEMPEFEEAYLKYGKDIHFMLVNVTDGSRETVEVARSYIDGQGYTFPIYFDTTLEAAIEYGASSIPLTFFLDANGNFVAYGSGALDAATLQKGINMILPE